MTDEEEEKPRRKIKKLTQRDTTAPETGNRKGRRTKTVPEILEKLNKYPQMIHKMFKVWEARDTAVIFSQALRALVKVVASVGIGAFPIVLKEKRVSIAFSTVRKFGFSILKVSETKFFYVFGVFRFHWN